MIKQTAFWLVGLAMSAACVAANAGSIQFNLTVDQAAKTWAVTATNGTPDNKGIAGFNIDITTTGDVQLLKMATAAQTNWAPTGFSDVRTTGTLANGQLTALSGFQATVNAFSNMDDSGLVYNDGFVPASGAAQGPLQLARGRYTGTLGTIVVTPQSAGGKPSITLFPLNYDVNGDGAGNFLPNTTQATIQATSAPSVSVQVGVVPEPSTIILAGLAGVGLVVSARRRKTA